ncbi:MAG: PHP domain-containing protein [Acidimicrobiales bacterium]
MSPDVSAVPGPVAAALGALGRCVYLLDRSLAPSAKVRAFQRAAQIVTDLGDAALTARVTAATLTDVDGIGPSTGSVIADAVLGRPGTYLADLEERSTVTAEVGGELLARLRGDCHTHSVWSDGGAPIDAMADAATSLGRDYIVVTDHSARLTIAHGLDEERLAAQLDEIESLNSRLAPFRILTGMEVDILADGTLDLSGEMLARLDLVVASVHSKLSMPPAEMTRRLVSAVASPHTDVLGHPTNRKVVGRGRPPSDFDADVVFAACARFDTAVEINCRPERLDPPDDMIRTAAQWGCRFAIDTDAHAPGQLEWLAYGADKATRAGVEPAAVVNTMDADELLAWTASHG